MEQRAATVTLQRTRFWLVLLSSAHVVPAAFISALVLLRQVCFGRPTLRFPCGFQSRACLVMLDAGFRSVWPIQPHLRFLISVSIGVCFVLSHSCSLETTSGHLMLRMFLRHLLVNVCSLWVLVLVPRGCNLVAVGGLVCLDDPESYAGWRLVSWQGHPCQKGQGVETRQRALTGPPG